MIASRLCAALLAAGLVSAVVFAQRSTTQSAGDPAASPQAISGSPSSGRHCVSGQAANVHALGWVQAGTSYAITFDAEIALVTSAVRFDFDGRESRSSYGTPDLNVTTSTSGTMALLVSGNGRAGCYRYKVQLQPPAGATFNESAGLPGAVFAPALVKPAKSPIQMMAVSGVASSAKLCVGPDGVARVHSLGRVEAGSRVNLTFDSDFDAQASVTNTDLAGQRGAYWIDDDSGGNLDPQLNMTPSYAGTMVVYVSGVGGSTGCYHYKVDAPGAAPSPAPTPSPSPTPSPTPTPAPGGTRSFKSVWITASWSGGRTGSPLNSRGIDPLAGTFFGSLCLANSVTLTLEDHPERATSEGQRELWAASSCGPMTVAFCRTAGSGGGASSIPICAVDPKETPFNNVYLAPRIGSRTYIGTAPPSFDINVFWCSSTSHINALGTLVSGVPRMDCVAN
jgi:hypothetical protein